MQLESLEDTLKEGLKMLEQVKKEDIENKRIRKKEKRLLKKKRLLLGFNIIQANINAIVLEGTSGV